MATETISWNGIVGGGASAPLNSGSSYDTGEVIASFTTLVPGSNAVTINTTATDPDNDPTNPDNSQLSLSGHFQQPVGVTVNLADDTTQTGTYGAYDATFRINDIDAGASADAYQDRVTIKALDTDGNPLTVTVSPNSGYTVSTNPTTGEVTITGVRGTNSWNSPQNSAVIQVQGGPIGSISVTLDNVGPAGSHNIMMTNITYQTQLVVCFAAGTMIETDQGEVAVETLQPGDLVRTADHGFQPVRWAASNTISAAMLAVVPEMRPVRISAGALGAGLPEKDLLVSPQHRVMVRSRIAQKMFGSEEVLVAAKQLVMLDGVDVVDGTEPVTYVHFLCDRHEVVYANGAPSESLFTGPEALKSVGSAARKEILALFPELAEVDYDALASRPLASGRMARRLAHRHAQNNKMLLT